MPWQEISYRQALDLDTLKLGDRVRLITTSKTIPTVELEKLSHELDADAMDHAQKVIDAEGNVLDARSFHDRAGVPREHLANRYFKVNDSDYSPVVRIVCASMNFSVPPKEPFGSWEVVRVKGVEIWIPE